MIDIVECPICKGHDLEHFLNVQDHSISKEEFRIVKCSGCGFKITSPRPKDEDLGAYYESEDYVSHSDTSKGIINTAYQQVKNITLRQKEKMIAGMVSKKTLLDLGCGTGDFLLFCKNKGWEVSGLEPDMNARKRAHEKGLTKVKDAAELFELKERFSIISMWHVLEHVADLNAYMEKLHELLEDNGRLIIAVPNPDSPDAKKYKSYWAAYDVPRHLWHFSKNNIRDLANKHAFTLEEVKPMVFDAYYVAMLSEKYQKGNIFNAAINGLRSNTKAKSDKNYSSLIYILSKKAK